MTLEVNLFSLDFWSAVAVLGDGKSVDCRAPNKHSDGEKKVKAVRCPI